MNSYSVNFENIPQWRPSSAFLPQWDTDTSLYNAASHSQIRGNDAVFTEDNDRVMMTVYFYYKRNRAPTTGLIPKNTPVKAYEGPDYALTTSAFSPFPTESCQLSDPIMLIDTSSGDDNPFIEPPESSDYSLQADAFNNMLNPDHLAYRSATLAPYDYNFLSSSDSTDTSSGSPATYDFNSCEDISTQYLEEPNLIDSPSFGAYCASYASNSSSTSEWSTTSEWSNDSPIIALGTFESWHNSVTEYTPYPLGMSSINDVAVDHASNARARYDTSPPSSLYGSRSSEALGDRRFGKGEPAIDETQHTQDPNSHCAGQNANTITMFLEENEDIENIHHAQQTRNKQSAWAINSFNEEGIVHITSESDLDTGAGPSTGSNAATSMLDIERAQQGQRDWSDSVSTAPGEQRRTGKLKAVDVPETPAARKKLRADAGESEAPESQKRKGKRKAVDVPEIASASNKMRAESPAQLMGNIASADLDEDLAFCLPGFEQKPISRYIHMSFQPETARSSEKQPSTSGLAPTLATFKLEENGSMTPRGVTFIDEVEGWKKG